MTITTATLLAYVRDLDVRFNAMTDDALIEKIKYGVHNLSSHLQCFSKNATLPLDTYFNNQIFTATISPTEEVIDYYYTGTIRTADGVDENINVIFEKLANKTMVCHLPEHLPSLGLYSVKVSYFYYLTISANGTYEIEPEVYNMMKHAIQVVMWETIKDYEKGKIHQAYLVDYVNRRITQIPDEIQSYGLKGGFV